MLSGSANGLKVIFLMFFAFALIFVSCRIYIRSRKTKTFASDDCFLQASLASFSLFTAAGLMSVEHGIGSKPVEHPDTRVLSDSLRFWFISEVFHISTVTLLRLAFALHLRTLAKSTAQKWTLLVLMAITITYNTGFLLLALFQCSPVQYDWSGWLVEGEKTMDQGFVELVSYGYAGVGAGTDWALVLVSPWFFWDTDMSGRAKFCLRALMITGICAGASSLVRIPTTKALLTTHDFFLDCFPIAIGSIVESGLGMMALSATTFRPLYPQFFAAKPKENPKPSISPDSDEKQALESNPTRTSSSVTGVQIPAQTTTQRKVSDEKLRDK